MLRKIKVIKMKIIKGPYASYVTKEGNRGITGIYFSAGIFSVLCRVFENLLTLFGILVNQVIDSSSGARSLS